MDCTTFSVNYAELKLLLHGEYKIQLKLWLLRII